jgi:hypothetical protein
MSYHTSIIRAVLSIRISQTGVVLLPKAVLHEKRHLCPIKLASDDKRSNARRRFGVSSNKRSVDGREQKPPPHGFSALLHPPTEAWLRQASIRASDKFVNGWLNVTTKNQQAVPRVFEAHVASTLTSPEFQRRTPHKFAARINGSMSKVRAKLSSVRTCDDC